MNKNYVDVYVVHRETGNLVYMLVNQGVRIVREYADGRIENADGEDLFMARREDIEETGS